MKVARIGWLDGLLEIVQKLPEGKQILTDGRDDLFMRRMDYESGRSTPPAPAPSAVTAVHGFR